MDAHTARCLQLSTSICMPFNPYRPRQPMGGSRFPIKATAFSSRPRSMTAGSAPHQTWTNCPQASPVTYVPYQKPVTTASTPQFEFVPQQPRAKSVQASCVAETMEREASYFQGGLAQNMQNPHHGGAAGNPWNDASKSSTSIAEQRFANPFDLPFDSKLEDFSQIDFSGTEVGPFDETIRLDDVESWALEPSSPDRQSLSSFSVSSSGEGISDFPDIADLHSLDTDIFSGLGMGYDGGDMNPKSAPVTQSSSLGLTATHNASRRPSPTRSMTMPSQPTYATNLSLPVLKTQNCASPDGCHDNPFDGLDIPLEDVSYGMSSTLFDHSDAADLAAFSNFQSSPDTLFPTLTSTFTPTPTFQKSFPPPSILPSSAPYDHLFHKHGSSAIAASPHHHHHPSAYDSLSPAPDLYASLKTAPAPPPEEDMNPPSPSMKPRLQELRFPGDLYTPQYVRGHGNKREGWCGSCKPGRWLVLKNSAFWYDKSFTHGISAATGMPFDEPREKRRMRGNPEVWEGLCGGCGEWVGLVSSKRRGTTWFRHAYKCHTHQKPKDTPKRRRESVSSCGGGSSSTSHSRSSSKTTNGGSGSVAGKAKKVKVEGREESPESLVDISEVEENEEEGGCCGGGGGGGDRLHQSQSATGGNGITALQTLSSIL